jgi:Rrf2 family nitric oxide-sensitive transcriptional repressor
MRLTSFSDYTLRVLMYLALERDRLATIPEIAAAYGVSRNHLMKVVHQLGQAGVIETVRGKGGGLRLAREPGAIRIGAIVREAEGAGRSSSVSRGASTCPITPVCRLSRVLSKASTRSTTTSTATRSPTSSAIVVRFLRAREPSDARGEAAVDGARRRPPLSLPPGIGIGARA